MWIRSAFEMAGVFFLDNELACGVNLVYTVSMVKTFEQAIAEVATLPDTDQEQIGLRLLSHVEKLRQLREEVGKGIRSLDAGEGKPLDIEEFLKQRNA